MAGGWHHPEDAPCLKLDAPSMLHHVEHRTLHQTTRCPPLTIPAIIASCTKPRVGGVTRCAQGWVAAPLHPSMLGIRGIMMNTSPAGAHRSGTTGQVLIRLEANWCCLCQESNQPQPSGTPTCAHTAWATCPGGTGAQVGALPQGMPAAWSASSLHTASSVHALGPRRRSRNRLHTS